MSRRRLEKVSAEKATIVSMDAPAFKEAIRELEGQGVCDRGNFKDWLMLVLKNALTFPGPTAHQDSLHEGIAAWKAFMPQIPVDGQGYEGTFLDTRGRFSVLTGV